MIRSLFVQHRRRLIRLCHLLLVAFSLTFAFLLRFDFSLPASQTQLLYGGLDKGWWRFVGVRELYEVFLANVGGSGLFTVSCLLAFGFRFPRSVYFVDFLLCFLTSAGARFAVRFYYEAVASEVNKDGGKGLLIYGAGQAGMTLLREILANPALGYQVIGFLDDDPNKRGASFMNVPILGAGRDAPRIVDRRSTYGRKVEESLIAMPSAASRQMQEA